MKITKNLAAIAMMSASVLCIPVVAQASEALVFTWSGSNGNGNGVKTGVSQSITIPSSFTGTFQADVYSTLTRDSRSRLQSGFDITSFNLLASNNSIYKAGIGSEANGKDTWQISLPSLASGTYKVQLIGTGSKDTNTNNVFGASYAITSPVPEPETYAMFLAGLGIVALIARRKTVQSKMFGGAYSKDYDGTCSIA